LRFLLQEFDLPPGEVIIGRSPDCHITIEDPLISRQHAKLVVTDQACVLHDLGSRNGSKLNGRAVSVPTTLKDCDRVRIGAQELVFFEMGLERRATRATGAMRLCNSCGSPFAEGASECPHCGASQSPKEEETMSGVVLEPRRTWMLQLMGEVLDRAIGAGKVAEAERMLRRATDEFADRSSGSDGLDLRQLAHISEYALKVAAIDSEPTWLRWVVNAYCGVQSVPPDTSVALFEAVAKTDEHRVLLAHLVRTLRGRRAPLSAQEQSTLQKLASLSLVS
jgi:hypothetical protein